MIIGGVISGYYLDSKLFIGVHNNILFHIVCFAIGLLIMFFVIKISKNTGRTLAKYGRKGEVKTLDTNILVRDGIYRYMRHPMHLGLLFFPLSIAFLVASPSFILIISPIEMLFMLGMIKFWEESEAIKKFGGEYLAYKKRTPWFCFTIKCLTILLKDIPKIKKK